MAVLTVEPAEWSALDWVQLQDKNPERNRERQRWALQVLNNLLQDHNTAIDAHTGGGKTIMALLIHLAIKRNTLLLVPTVELARQHKNLFHKLLGRKNYVVVMTGNDSPEKRVKKWQEFVTNNGKIVIATPHTIINDIKNGFFPIGYFSFLCIDEFHHAHKKYPYVPLALAAQKAGALILSLSATAKDFEALKNCFVNQIVNVTITTPPKYYKILAAKPSQSLNEVNEKYQKILSHTIGELVDLKLVAAGTKLLTNVELKKLAQTTELPGILPYPKNRTARSIVGRYGYLNYLQRVLKVCSYHNFIEESDKLQYKNRQYAKWILNNRDFQQILSRVQDLAQTETHPKLELLTSTVLEALNRGKTFIIFVNEKSTARVIANEIGKIGFPVDYILGGQDEKNHRKEVIGKILAGEIKGLVGTPVIDEGISLPGVDIAFLYGRNYTAVQRIQRSGRVGRGNEPGEIISILLDDPIEWIMENKTNPHKLKKEDKTVKSIKASKLETFWLPFTEDELQPKIVKVSSIKDNLNNLYNKK